MAMRLAMRYTSPEPGGVVGMSIAGATPHGLEIAGLAGVRIGRADGWLVNGFWLGVDPSILDAMGLIGVCTHAAPAVLFVFLVVALEPLDATFTFEREDVGRDAV